jgi:16S rRNA processing protein RimM
MSEARADLLCVARVLKSNGTNGEVIIGFRGYAPEVINLKEPLYIYFDGLAVPFFIESFTIKGSRAAARLTSVKCLRDAEELEGRDVFVCKDAINEYSDGEDSLSIDELIGWTVLNDSGNEVGTVAAWEDIPGNPCLYVKTASGKEVMVPFNESLLINLDEAGKKIALHIPEGLI